MNWLPYLLAGGFAKGYRTYILAGVSALGWLAAYVVGDLGLVDLLKQDWQTLLLNAAVVTAARHKV